MKYMILHYASQADYDGMSGKDNASGRAWTPDEVTALGEFMSKWTNQLVETGEYVGGEGLAAPVHTRRVAAGNVVTDGPYAETTEVVVGFTIVDCASFDRATEIAAKLADCPGPDYVRARGYVDVRPIMNSLDELTA